LDFLSSDIQENRKHNVSEAGSVSIFWWGGKTCTLLSHLERANLSHWTRGPTELVGVFPPHLKKETIQLPKRRVFYFLEYRMMKKAPKPSNSVLYNIVRTLYNLLLCWVHYMGLISCLKSRFHTFTWWWQQSQPPKHASLTKMRWRKMSNIWVYISLLTHIWHSPSFTRTPLTNNNSSSYDWLYRKILPWTCLTAGK
jgi:hypothetical protein